jgi:hypothetical protein
MVDYWEEYKEMVFMLPFIVIAFAGQPVLGHYFSWAFWGSIVFLVGGLVGMPTAVQYEAYDLNPVLADVYGPNDYGGNNRLQFFLAGVPDVKRLGPKRYRVIQPLRAPYVKHPKWGPIKNWRYFCEYPPNVLFTAKRNVTINFKGSYSKNSHGDTAIIYEREPFNAHFRSEPQYEVVHATNTWAIRSGRLSDRDIREAEAQIQEVPAR